MTYNYGIEAPLLCETYPFRFLLVFPQEQENTRSPEMHFANKFAEFVLEYCQSTYIVDTFFAVRADHSVSGQFQTVLELESHQEGV